MIVLRKVMAFVSILIIFSSKYRFLAPFNIAGSYRQLRIFSSAVLHFSLLLYLVPTFLYAKGVFPFARLNASENLLALTYPTLPAITVTGSSVCTRRDAAKRNR